jgi:hypothetical protein
MMTNFEYHQLKLIYPLIMIGLEHPNADWFSYSSSNEDLIKISPTMIVSEQPQL